MVVTLFILELESLADTIPAKGQGGVRKLESWLDQFSSEISKLKQQKRDPAYKQQWYRTNPCQGKTWTSTTISIRIVFLKCGDAAAAARAHFGT
ncbi:hypothetical protein EDD11_000272 [Mortierella claussenii]|nr:hypothetical protein EDD11_000272 [Mortierella claussenii]